MTKEVLKLALEALELHGKQYPHMVKGYCLDAITAIREALAEQPAQVDPCPGCLKGRVCRTPKCGRLKLPADHPLRSEQPAQQPAQQLEQEPCQCPECQITLHTSDCAVHNEPAYPKGACSCKAQPEQEHIINCPRCGHCCPQQQALEPMAWMVYTLDGNSVCVTDNPADFGDRHRALPLYTAPQPRQWQGLTVNDLSELGNNTEWLAGAQWADAKLREKNA